MADSPDSGRFGIANGQPCARAWRVHPAKTFAFVAALVALTATSFAQDKAANLVLAREVIAAMHADKMFDGMVGQMKQMAMQSVAVPPDATPEQKAKATELQGRIIELTMQSAKGLINQLDQVYADVYTEAELRAMKAFFLSPEGQSMLAKQPQVMGRVMPLVQKMQQDLMPQIQKLVAEAKTPAGEAAP